MNRRQLLCGLAALPVAGAAVVLAAKTSGDGIALTSMAHPHNPPFFGPGIQSMLSEVPFKEPSPQLKALLESLEWTKQDAVARVFSSGTDGGAFWRSLSA